METTEEGRWKAVADQVANRFASLSMSKAEFAKRSGVSHHTLNAVLRGEPIRRAGKRGELAVGLGWTPDSIDRVLAGKPPLLATSRGDGDGDDRLDVIDGRLVRIEELLELLVDESRASS